MDEMKGHATREKFTLHFQHLPKYAQFILETRLENFVHDLLLHSREIEIPLLKYFSSLKEDQMLSLVRESNRKMLTLLTDNKAQEYIDQSKHAWLQNQLPAVQRDQVIAEDITMVNFVRRKAFRNFLLHYTTDPTLVIQLQDEIDLFLMTLESTLFNSYIQLQQQKISNINTDLQKREMQLLEAQEIAQIGSFDWDLSGKTSSYTPQVFKIFEMERTSNLESFLNDVHPDDRLKLRNAIEKGFETGLFECEYRYNKNNKDKVLWSRGVVAYESGKPARLKGTIMDVTIRHQIIRQLEQSEELHKQAQAITHLGNWTWDIQHNTMKWSDEMYRIFGLAPQSEEISFDKFLSFIHQSDKKKVTESFKESMAALSVNESHFRIETADGKQKILRSLGDIIVNEKKEPVKIVGTCQDITREFLLNEELKKRQEYTTNLNKSLEQKNKELLQKNKELESFNFIASHDLQEPLRKIQIYSNRILEKTTEQLSEYSREHFQKIVNASGRMQNLIEDFLSFSQTIASPKDFERVDLAKMLEEVKSDLHNVIEDKKAIIESSPLYAIDAIPFQIKQLLVNMIGNSLKYNKEGTPPLIRINATIMHGSKIADEWAVPGKSYLKLTISDNGIGFEQKYASKIFDVFQRLHGKDTYSGTGIGLAICKKVVQNHNGSIDALGELGLGAIFNIYLPQKQSG